MTRPIDAATFNLPGSMTVGETPTAEELVNELWEAMFSATHDRVPDELTDEALMHGARALLAGYSIFRKTPPQRKRLTADEIFDPKYDNVVD